MRNNILFLLFILTSTYFFGQNTRDVVYLKNGSIVKGKITEMNPAENLKIQTADGSLFVYKMIDIEKMEKEEFVGQEMNQETSSEVSQEALDTYFKNYLAKNRPALLFVGISKKNGVKREIYGQKVYEIEYELIMETKQDIFINTSGLSAFATSFNVDFSYTSQNTSGYEAALTGNKERIQKGQRIVANGSISFEETDNGWRAKNFKNSNFKTVSSNYVTPEMAEKMQAERVEQIKLMAQEREKKTEIKKKEGDWNKEDIGEVNFNSIFLLAENVPVFNSVAYKISLEKLSDKCKDCRNDNFKAIQESVFETFHKTNRYSKLNESLYITSENIGLINILIEEITFDYKVNYDENGRGSEGYTCKILYKLKNQANLKQPMQATIDENNSYNASTRSSQFYTSKRAAFDKALEDLKGDIENITYSKIPIELELVRIELDKRDKVDKIILKKPSHFFNKTKIEFILLRKNDIEFNDHGFKVENIIAECNFKGEMTSDEIICDVSGAKNKKILTEFVNNTNEIVAINSMQEK